MQKGLDEHGNPTTSYWKAKHDAQKAQDRAQELEVRLQEAYDLLDAANTSIKEYMVRSARPILSAEGVNDMVAAVNSIPEWFWEAYARNRSLVVSIEDLIERG